MVSFSDVTNESQVRQTKLFIRRINCSIISYSRFAEFCSNILNSKVAPVAEKTLSGLKFGTKAFKFTKIQMGEAKPKFSNLKVHKKSNGTDRIVVDFDFAYLGNSDIQAAILKIPVGIK